MDHLGHSEYKPSTVAVLMDDLGLDARERDPFGMTLANLAKAKKIVVNAEGEVMLPPIGDEIIGTFRKNPRGFGFVIPEDKVREGDVFIPPDGVSSALTGDRVKVAIKHQRRNGADDIVGQIIEVLGRKRKSFSGELMKQGATWLVHPDGKELTRPVVVRDPEAKNAKAGDKVIIEITHYPEGDMLPEGVIVKVLGEAGLPSVETQAVIAAYNLPGDFPEACYEQARQAAENYELDIARLEREGFKDRDDLRDDFIITIDPPDAKDYDDAISIRRTNEGWELGVHIADVAHFIAPGSPLDTEAQSRGNSCYLPRLVIPMLPENLSNGICSLQEGVPRFCKSSFMVYDRQGKLLKSGVSQVLIKSKKRLTYLEAQALIDGNPEEAKKHAKTEPNYTPELITALKEMDACAKAIRVRRREAGMIHLELPEVELVYDENGRVIDAVKEDDAFTHTLIEMFMVEANEVLARLFERVKVPLIRRVHPEPTPGDVDELRSTAKVAGFAIPKKPTRKELQTLLDATKGTAAAPAVHFAVLRTLTKAEYSPAPIGHYALASEAYAHFTSPIRRYPDLTVHRALAAYLSLTDNGRSPPRTDEAREELGKKLREHPLCPEFETLIKIGGRATQTEVNAAAAESSLRSFLVLQLLSEKVGETYRGMVTGVSPKGIFVRLEKYLADGFITTETLPAGKDGRVGAWRIDQRSGALVNQASGRSYAVGDTLTVTIAKVDLAMRKLDLAVTDPTSRDKAKGKKIKEVDPDSLAARTGGGGLGLDWDKIKFGGGKTGAQNRDQRSKDRDRGKTNHRRDR